MRIVDACIYNNEYQRNTLGLPTRPPLDTQSTSDNAAALTGEINEKGVYIHKISRDLARPNHNSERVRGQLTKITKGNVPTPATLVGPTF